MNDKLQEAEESNEETLEAGAMTLFLGSEPFLLDEVR